MFCVIVKKRMQQMDRLQRLRTLSKRQSMDPNRMAQPKEDKTATNQYILRILGQYYYI